MVPAPQSGAWEAAHRQSIESPAAFWGEVAEAIDWTRRGDRVLDDSRPPYYRWFPGGELNTCYNCIDRHVEAGRGDQVAIIYDSPVTQTVRRYTYRELRDLTARFAGVLAAQGVVKGDRVIIYMPMVPEALVAMLACARLGAVHSVVFGGFAAPELATRIDDAKPRIVVSASCGVEVQKIIAYKPLVDAAIDIAQHKPDCCIILQREMEPARMIADRDIDWAMAMQAAEPHDCVPVKATDPLYILYTSGTTGQPKGVVRDNGGHAVALRWTMTKLYNVQPGEVFWSASDIGWGVGHSYIVYAPLLTGCTTVVYEGKPVATPDAGAFWRVIAEHKVTTLFTAPTALRAIKRDDPEAKLLHQYDLSNFRALFLAGERSDSATLEWAEQHLKVPVVDHWWQTETGWCIVGNCLGIEHLPVKHGSPTQPLPGLDVCVLGEGWHAGQPGDTRNLVCRLPLPPGTLIGLW